MKRLFRWLFGTNVLPAPDPRTIVRNDWSRNAVNSTVRPTPTKAVP
jgi:hypothetical protein